MENKAERIAELVEKLNAASEAYYSGSGDIMTDYEWDALFDELGRLEEETGIILPQSPTRKVSGNEDSGGKKEPHEFPALSLAKTKKIEDLQAWAGNLPIWLSWKLDGLTLVLTYDGGELMKILTRGNGTIGSNITYMKDSIKGFPLRIDYKGHLVVRGETTISYPDFERINASLDDGDGKYANPRNLASGTLSLDAKNLATVKERNLCFNAFTLVHTDEKIISWGERMNLLESWGFTVVDREKTNAAELPQVVKRWTERVEKGLMPIPVDGLVVAYDDTEYASTGSVTGHHATRAGLAFKWQDESALSVLDHIEWSCAASTITPVAVFAPVQLEGTTVSRASLCNVSELERLGIGENGKTELKIIKANKIIPKCVAVTRAEGKFTLPSSCPVCGSATELKTTVSGTKTLRCTNPLCAAKNLMKFVRFADRNTMNIDGLSIETLRDFINAGFIKDVADIYSLEKYSGEIKSMEGYGEKSCANLLAAIEKSRKCEPVRLINALSIPLIGIDAAKKITAYCGWKGFLERLESGEGFEDLEGIGPEKSGSILQWYADVRNRGIFEKLLAELDIENTEPSARSGGTCEGITFVITGDVHTFKNRDEFKAFVEEQGGKVAGSVSGKTGFLVNNDAQSESSKNKKAKELGVSIITEDEFLEKFGI